MNATTEGPEDLRRPVDDEPKPNLGCATTGELIEELAARARVSATIGEDWPLYRTIDDH